jgi:hypothetical protein
MRICRRVGCVALVAAGSGYCPKHIGMVVSTVREGFDSIKKTPEARKFYSGSRWTKCSKRHLEIEPLCRKCKAEGKTTVATISHHNPPREELIKMGLSPYDDKLLESICLNHHQAELRKK